MEEKILTQKQVYELGLNKISVITADMLEGYTSIGERAFLGCESLISIEIPNSITSIREYAFTYCSGLTHIEIPDSVTDIGWCVFDGCVGLTSPVYNAHIFMFMPSSYSGVYTILNGIKSIADGAFGNCTGLASVVIPNSVTSIGDSAFYQCVGLTSIIIPDSVTNIGNGAFEGCSGLTSVVIPDSVTNVGTCAFDDCTSLTSLAIGDKTYEKQTVTNGKCKAYKGFNSNMTCRDFQYEEGKSYEYDGEVKLCVCGFHACLSLSDVFNYYHDEFGKDVVVYEVELEGVSDERNKFDSKVVAKKITIGKRIL